MVFIVRILPLLLVAGWLYFVFTAGSRSARQMRRNSSPMTDWAILERVRGLEQALEVSGLEVRILETPMINAAATASSEVYVTRGLYDAYLAGKMRRSDMIAVIAHELGHVALGHMNRRLAQLRVETAGLAIAGVLLSRVLLGWISLAAMVLLPLLRGALSRRDEFEADAFAVELLIRADQDPRGLIRALEKTERMNDVDPRAQPARWLRSHPSTVERAEAIEARIARLGGARAAE